MKITKKILITLAVGTSAFLHSQPALSQGSGGFVERTDIVPSILVYKDTSGLPNPDAYEDFSTYKMCWRWHDRPVTLYYNPRHDWNGAFADLRAGAHIGENVTQPSFAYGAHGGKPGILSPRGVITGNGSAWNLHWNSVETAGYNAGQQYANWAKRNNIPIGESPLGLVSCHSYENAPLFTRGVNSALHDAGFDKTMIPHVSGKPGKDPWANLEPATINPKTAKIMEAYYKCESSAYNKMMARRKYGNPDIEASLPSSSRSQANFGAGMVLTAYMGLQADMAVQAIKQARANDRSAQLMSRDYDRADVPVTDEVRNWRTDPMNPNRFLYDTNPELAMRRNQAYYAHDGQGNWHKKRYGCKWWQY